jgi:hypothetical protein
MRKRRARVDRDGIVHCRKCGSQNLLVRSGEPDDKVRQLKCAVCDERQRLRTRDLQKLLGKESAAALTGIDPDTEAQLVFDGFEQAGESRHRLSAPRRIG